MVVTELARCGVLCFGGEDWWYHNRGHCDMQYMRQFARFAPVLYINSVVMRKPNIAEGRMFLTRLRRKAHSMARGMVRVSKGFWVYSPLTAPVHHLPGARAVNQWLLGGQVRLAMQRAGLRRPLIWVNCPVASDVAIRLSRIRMVYQRTDRYEEFPGVEPQQIARHDQTLKRHADLTFFSSQQLFQEEGGQCRRAAYVDHGVDYERFAEAEHDPWIPPELRGLKRPVAGFYGGIDAHTFDMQLMAEVVSHLPEVTFVFVGRASIDCTPLTRHANVVMVGQRPYEQIPHYGKCFDVCLMPWNQNRWIQACNPVKLKEYLALGKMVVSTPFPELENYNSAVRQADNAARFAAAVAECLTSAAGGAVAAARLQVAAHDWPAKSQCLLDMIFPDSGPEALARPRYAYHSRVPARSPAVPGPPAERDTQ